MKNKILSPALPPCQSYIQKVYHLPPFPATVIDSFNDIADYIQGTVPGVIVQKSGGTVRYIIRGVSTNSDFTDPLLMIDGVEVDSFDSVIPSQVESVEVIKDGSASIYGIRGGGGVIMLTLKKE